MLSLIPIFHIDSTAGAILTLSTPSAQIRIHSCIKNRRTIRSTTNSCHQTKEMPNPIEPHPTPTPCIHLHRHPSHLSCRGSETMLFIVVFICFFVLSLDDRRNSILCRCFRRRDVHRCGHGKSMCHPPRWLSSSGTFMPFGCSAAFWNQTVSTSLPGLPPLLRGALATTLKPKSIFFLVFLFCFVLLFFLGGRGGILF